MSNENPDANKVSWWERICTWKNKLSELKIFTVNGSIDKYYKKTLFIMIGDEKKLKLELIRLRSEYNCWSNFISKFIPSLIITFVFGIYSQSQHVARDNTLVSFIMLILLFIVLFEALSCKVSNEEYEKIKLVEAELEKIEEAKSKCEEMTVLEAELNEMKLIRAELEKINNTVQPNPKK